MQFSYPIVYQQYPNYQQLPQQIHYQPLPNYVNRVPQALIDSKRITQQQVFQNHQFQNIQYYQISHQQPQRNQLSLPVTREYVPQRSLTPDNKFNKQSNKATPQQKQQKEIVLPKEDLELEGLINKYIGKPTLKVVKTNMNGSPNLATKLKRENSTGTISDKSQITTMFHHQDDKLSENGSRANLYNSYIENYVKAQTISSEKKKKTNSVERGSPYSRIKSTQPDQIELPHEELRRKLAEIFDQQKVGGRNTQQYKLEQKSPESPRLTIFTPSTENVSRPQIIQNSEYSPNLQTPVQEIKPSPLAQSIDQLLEKYQPTLKVNSNHMTPVNIKTPSPNQEIRLNLEGLSDKNQDGIKQYNVDLKNEKKHEKCPSNQIDKDQLERRHSGYDENPQFSLSSISNEQKQDSNAHQISEQYEKQLSQELHGLDEGFIDINEQQFEANANSSQGFFLSNIKFEEYEQDQHRPQTDEDEIKLPKSNLITALSKNLSVIEEEEEVKQLGNSIQRIETEEESELKNEPQILMQKLNDMLAEISTKIDSSSKLSSQQTSKIQEIKQKYGTKKSKDEFYDFQDLQDFKDIEPIQVKEEEVKQPETINQDSQEIQQIKPKQNEIHQTQEILKKVIPTKFTKDVNTFKSLIIVILLSIIVTQVANLCYRRFLSEEQVI